jgi:hypothetical protein
VKFASLLTFSLISLLCSYVSADMAPLPMSGGVSLYTNSSTGITMVEEEVTIKVFRKGCAAVEAIFLLRNDGQGETLQVGFPYSYSDELQGFSATIDAKEVAFQIKEDGYKPNNFFGKQKTLHWKSWTMTMDANSQETVTVKYANDISTSLSGCLDSILNSDKKLLYESWSREGYVHYIMRTGALWKGKIGKAKIKIVFEDFTPSSITGCRPEGAIIKEKEVTYEFFDFEPKDDIYVRFCF